MPFYLVVLTFCAKALITMFVVGPNTIGSSTASPTWKIIANSLFNWTLLALGLQTMCADISTILESPSESWWQWYECASLVVATSSNCVTAGMMFYLPVTIQKRAWFIDAHNAERPEEADLKRLSWFEILVQVYEAKGLPVALMLTLGCVHVVFCQLTAVLPILGFVMYMWLTGFLYWLSFLVAKCLAVISLWLKTKTISQTHAASLFEPKTDSREMQAVMRKAEPLNLVHHTDEVLGVRIGNSKQIYQNDITNFNALGTTSAGVFLPFQGAVMFAALLPITVLLGGRLIEVLKDGGVWEHHSIDWKAFGKSYLDIVCDTFTERHWSERRGCPLTGYAVPGRMAVGFRTGVEILSPLPPPSPLFSLPGAACMGEVPICFLRM